MSYFCSVTHTLMAPHKTFKHEHQSCPEHFVELGLSLILIALVLTVFSLFLYQ